MTSTGFQVLGWIIGLMSWGASVAMTLSEQWRVSSLAGDRGTIVDLQGRYMGLWSSCNSFPSSQIQCSLLPIELGDVDSVIIGCRALMILSILFGIVGGLIVLFSFKCTTHGPQDKDQKALLGKYGGGIYLMCGVCVATCSAWYTADVYASVAFPDARGNPIKWRPGQAAKISLAAGILWILASFAVMYGSRQKKEEDPYAMEKKPLEEYV